MAEVQRPKFIQIATAMSADPGDPDGGPDKCLYALDENGDVWFFSYFPRHGAASWQRLEMDREP